MSKRTAVVHEWVSARAGSEKVFENLAGLFPAADLFSLTYEPGVILDTGNRQVTTTFLDREFWRRHRALSLPLMALAWRQVEKGEYDRVISSSHSFAREFCNSLEVEHFSYVHAPMRYAWNPEIDTRGNKPFAKFARTWLQNQDLKTVPQVDHFAANSSAVAARINEFYDRDATVIYPPVDIDFFKAGPVVPFAERSRLLALGRLIDYKGFDTAIRVAARTQMPIDIVGRGPELAKLQRLALDIGADATFDTSASDEAVRDYYANAAALIFPAVEDFGMTPVEAQAAGTPIVGYAAGGLCDSVDPGRTGFLVEEFSIEALAHSVDQLSTLPAEVGLHCRQNAERFSVAAFADRISAWTE